MTDRRNPPVDIDDGVMSYALAFSANGEYLLSGGFGGVRVWRVEDGQETATMEALTVQCLAVSKDGRWIAAGTSMGGIHVWDSTTHEQVISRKSRSPTYDPTSHTIHGLDFSPDSTRLVTASQDRMATIWDIPTRKEVLELRHVYYAVIGAKFSPQGDRIATTATAGTLAATDSRCNFVRVWDSSDGSSLLEIPVEVTPLHNTGLGWLGQHLLVISGSKIQQIEPSSGSTVSEWPVRDSNDVSCVALAKEGEFIACSTERTVTFWDTSTHTQLGLIYHSQDIRSITLSLDDRFIAISGKYGEITIKQLSGIIEPRIQIDHSALELWKHGQLANAEALLTAAIPKSQRATHHVRACRALIRARLGDWEAAVDDAKKSIKFQPSVIGYVAQSIALVGNGEKDKAYRECDIAFEQFRSSHVSFLLLIKAIVVFMAGEHDDGISRVDDLIAILHFNSTCYMAYMYLLLGNSYMERKNFASAIQSFRRARAQLRDHTSRPPFVVSLISGWKFDNLGITIQQQLCEALCAAGHAKEAGGVVLETVKTFGEEIYMSEAITKWVSDFARRCLATPSCDGDVASNAARNDEPQTRHSTLGSPIPSPLLREWARATLMYSPWKDALTTAVGFTAPRFTVYRTLCEHLEATDRIFDASECFQKMTKELTEEADSSNEQAEWILDFKLRCYEKLERVGDAAEDAQRHDEAITHYTAAISLDRDSSQDLFIKRSKVGMAKGLWEDALEDAKQAMELDPSSSWGFENILMEWANVNLMNGLWKGALSAARDFQVPRFTIYRAICEGLETLDGILDAIDCFHQMASELAEGSITQAPEANWVLDFKYRCSGKLERSGDSAMDSQQHDEALKWYSAALSIHPANTQGCFIMQSKVCMAKRSWKDAVDHANEAIRFDPTSPWGYETKRAALHGAGSYEDAIQTFETMLSKMAHSPDPQIRERRGHYISPSATRTMIRKIIQRTIRHSPRVLINTTTGRLHDKTEQTAAFMSLPIANELVSSMTARIDRSRIKCEVKQFFRYVMLSHKWEENEPLFQQVLHMAVYDLDQSPTHDKLQIFCKIVRDGGFNWAWSDTCCINKQDHFVLQEALVAMFKWYRGSAMMIVFLRGVHSQAALGELVKSIWNTRAWTLQEYVAAKVIRFYTEDWTPYFNLDTFNHKESPEIISEMEQATGVSAQQLMGLRPGLSNIREKLRLASTRQTTLVEDGAYSLLGIFSVSGIPAIYGEGESALGRLLAHILAGSGDTSILAWSGQSGGHNSCLPAHISVFNLPATSHHPPPIEDAQMEKVITMLRASAPDFDVALKLYDHLHELPAPWFAASRMKLPCIAFKLPPLSPDRTRSGRVYRVDTPFFGVIEIKTRQDPSRLNSLYLVHPWIDTLLDREDMQSGAFVEDDVAEPFSSGTEDEDVSDEELEDDTSPLRERRSPSPPPRMDTVPMDRETRALRLIARLRQPFGALLFTLVSTRRRSVVYRRIAADSTITVQLRENVPLNDILDNVRILDVL